MTTPARTKDVQEFLNERPMSGYQWLLFGICLTIVLLDGFDTAAIGYIAPSLLGEWGVEKSALGPVLTAALFGLAAGGALSGPIADRFGRRYVLTASVILMGAACLWSAYSTSLTELMVLRFITGIGLGAAMPNSVTLMGEFCPDSRRSLILNTMFCGFPLGAFLGGVIAAWMIPHFGWRSVLVAGGVAPLVLAVLMLVVLPESVRFLIANGRRPDQVKAILARISPEANAVERFTAGEGHAPKALRDPLGEEETRLDAGHATEPGAPANAQVGGARLVLSREFLTGSVALWTAYFMGLVIFYAIINWMPLLFKEVGMPASRATLITSLFSLGGLGAIASGALMDRMEPNRVIAACYLLTAGAVAAIGYVSGSVTMLVVAVLLAGILMNTAQSSMPALAAAFYPTRGRGTGVAWMMAIGRFGGIAGTALVGLLAARKASFTTIFLVLAVPGLIAGTAILVKQIAYRGRGPQRPLPREVTSH